MPRPGMLTRGRATRLRKTPGGELRIRRRKYYKARGSCAITGKPLQLPRKSKLGHNRTASKSSKRPNRPYGGVVTSKALKRGIIRQLRD